VAQSHKVLRAHLRSLALDVLSVVPRRPRPGVRILVYHWVHDHEREGFARQLAALAREFEPVSLTEAVERLQTGRVRGRELAITFDDGFRSGLVNAAPLLAEHGFRACYFLVTELVSAPRERVERISRDNLHLARPLELLDWDEVERLVELGHEVGSHTRTHRNLVALSHKELEEEVAGSRAELERRLGRAPAHFAAPYGDRGRFSSAVSAAVRAAGYETCLTAQRGRNVPGVDLYALRRDNLVASWPVRHLRYFLAAG
jgi:peptidoglycan/xylan/chitin deacetylase (PgdA/CDA1 family)